MIESFNNELFLTTLVLIGAVIVVSALLSGLVEKSGFPQVAVFLALGAAIGPGGLHLTDATASSPILRVVGTLSLALVLFTDAVSLNLSEVRKQKLISVLVVGPGTLLSAILIALISWKLLGLPFAGALTLGAALASTDPVMLRSLLGNQGLDGGVRQALRLEGGMNDAVLLPIVLVSITMVGAGHSPGPGEWAHLALSILILSPAAGAIVGLAAVGMLELVRKRVGIRRDYESIFSLGVAFAAFAAAESVHGSGFLAAFAAGLMISALDVELCDCFLEYGETTAEMALMFTFVLFGMSLIWTGLTIVSGVMLLFVLLVFLARPLAFLPALIPVRNLSWKNRALISWFGPRGLSSLLLVSVPVFAGTPGSGRLLTICCLVVLCSVVLHGLSPAVLIRTPRKMSPGVEHLPDAQPHLVPSPVSEYPQLRDGEFITVEETRALQAHGSAPVLIIDARSERSYTGPDPAAGDTIRLHPEQAVRSANEQHIPKNAVLAVLCA